MKLRVEAESQDEFELKRADAIRQLAGSKYDVILKARSKSVYQVQKPAISPRQGFYQAQNQMQEYWSQKFKAMLENIRKDIEGILK